MNAIFENLTVTGSGGPDAKTPGLLADNGKDLYYVEPDDLVERKIVLSDKPPYSRYFEVNDNEVLQLSFPDNHIECLSCLSVVEHIGLGRYGDKINPEGDLLAISELKRVLAFGGSLLLVVPIGYEPKLQFNAHRIYSHAQILDYFSELKLIEFAIIPDNKKDGDIVSIPSNSLLKKQEGVGCYWFKK